MSDRSHEAQLPKAALLMGSDSDFDAVKGCIAVLKEFHIECTVRVMSAHRTPAMVADFAKGARKAGYDVIIAAAGKAAHLAGVIAGHTTLPVIGIPVKSSLMDGLDSLLSTVQMPTGIPVATVAVNGADNAGYLAAQMLSLRYPELVAALEAHRVRMAEGIAKADAALNARLEGE